MVCRRRALWVKSIRLMLWVALFLGFMALPQSVAASLISAHTSNVISRTSEIQVQFSQPMVNSDQLNTELASSPFEFTPPP